MKRTEEQRQRDIERSRAWRAANPDKKREQNRAWYAANKEKHKARMRELYHAQTAEQRSRRKDLSRSRRRAARAETAGVDVIDRLDDHDLEQILSDQFFKCACGKELSIGDADCTLDHIIPVTRGGPHSAANAALLCVSCNSRKGDSYFSEWLDRKPVLDKTVVDVILAREAAVLEELK